MPNLFTNLLVRQLNLNLIDGTPAYEQFETELNKYIDARIDEKLKNYALKNHSHGKPSSLQRFG